MTDSQNLKMEATFFPRNYGSQRILHGVVITYLQTYKTCSSAPKTK